MSTTPPPVRKRIQAIDFIKGIDIVFMVLFNYSITLDHFNIFHIPSNYLYRSILPISIASIFIFLSGVSARISYEKDKENLKSKYFMRGMKLLLFASLITLFTYYFVYPNTIFFGILHFFAFSSFLIPFFIKYEKLNFFAGLSIILAGVYLQQRTFSFLYLYWLGFVPENLTTFDYFPVIPWLGVILLGIYYSRSIVEKTSNFRFNGRFSGIFVFLGRNSLTVYLIHQPVLILFLIASGLNLFLLCC